MEVRVESKLMQKYDRPSLSDFRDHIGEEAIVGLRFKSQFSNDRIIYLTGIVSEERINGSLTSLALYEIADASSGQGTANRIMPLNLDIPIVEALFKLKVVRIQSNISNPNKVDLVYTVLAEPHNHNSQLKREYAFKSH